MKNIIDDNVIAIYFALNIGNNDDVEGIKNDILVFNSIYNVRTSRNPVRYSRLILYRC